MEDGERGTDAPDSPAQALAWKWAMDGRLLIETEAEKPVEFKPTVHDENKPTFMRIALSRLEEVALILGSAKVSFMNGHADYQRCFDQIGYLNDGIREAEDKTQKITAKFCEMMEPEGLEKLFVDDQEALVKVAIEGLERMM